jgi:hypothetical protein
MVLPVVGKCYMGRDGIHLGKYLSFFEYNRGIGVFGFENKSVQETPTFLEELQEVPCMPPTGQARTPSAPPMYARTPSAPPMYAYTPPAMNEPSNSELELGEEIIPIANMEEAEAKTARGAAAMNPYRTSYAAMKVNQLSNNSKNRYASLGYESTGRNKFNKRGYTYEGPSTINGRKLQRMRANTLNAKKIFNSKLNNKNKKWYKFWGGKKTRKQRKTRNKSRRRSRPRV